MPGDGRDGEGLIDRTTRGFLELVARDKATGHLQPDFTAEDLVVLLMANAGVIAATADAAPDSWRRLVGQMLRAFATPGAPMPPMPGAPPSADLYRAMTEPRDRSSSKPRR
jgi:hypothetical protein